jgi:hypothetical protein
LHPVLFDAGVQHKLYFGSIVVMCQSSPTQPLAVETNAKIVAEAAVDSPGQRSATWKLVRNHFWIELEGIGNGSDCCRVVDYRLLWWVLDGKDKTIPPEYDGVLPHGVFNPADYSQVDYQKAAIVDEPVIGDSVFEALTNVEFNSILPASFFSS